MFRSLSVLVVLAAALGGCTSDGVDEPAPSVAPSAAAEDPPGALACGKVVVAVRDGTVMTAGVADAIRQASTTADAPVADAAQRLVEAHAAATGAVGTEEEPDKVAAVSAAAAEMVSVCRDSGLETAG